jgi:oxygen-independent coproporphyrinogen-3 oxidase
MSPLFGNLVDRERPYRCFVPQSVKIYPLHQLEPTRAAPRVGEWNPTMSADTRAYLGSLESSSIGRQLYMHVPFCPAFCHYCCLYKTTDPRQQGSDYIEGFTQRLLKEIASYAEVPAAMTRPVTSIYFGGGTPSMLTPGQVERILTAVRRSFPLKPNPEITFEGMPHQLKKRDYLAALIDVGVNRISYGVQTFQPALRKQLGRIDTVEDIIAAAESIRAVGGIGALNFELLMGVPGQDVRALLNDLEQSVRTGPDTLDVLFYNAVPGTKYYRMINQGQRPPQVAGDALLEMRRESIAFLNQSGFHQTTGEIFDREHGRLDNFNQTHYGGSTGLDEMVALGPSSYGFLDGVLYQNVADVKQYIDLVDSGYHPVRTWRPIGEAEARRRGLLFGIQLRKIRRSNVTGLFTRSLVESWKLRGLARAVDDGWELTNAGALWYNMMQLEVMPLSEAGPALDLTFKPEEQQRLLFRQDAAQGNVSLARELERLIEGPIPALRPLRRGVFEVMRRVPRRRPSLRFTGPEVEA